MIFRLQLLTLNIAVAILLIFFLCLGSQTENRIGYRLDFLGNETIEIPVGFWIGSSFTLGVITGGLTSVISTKNKTQSDKKK